ncbi:adenosylmethionine--8-amino-7-oxononanoate transaminase [Pedobacter sandarakinus]|uniref:adenosylmethionine--8-amino-7-oxononanoate transaminase n=1 Tax=Pedobacter sandarakinus TaxID=353156 RepID=UPI002246DFE8|nr:adenosylmethionine--8-amino-7-oxononanoate transaminase [Pedobacter sandarakinus]MCX2575196.1 adenosylmethionine--8-amino-7-oxononanoate transaminase [Pedobacter sandarakinus]
MKLWFPYKQMQNMEVPLEVDSGRGVYLNLSDGRSLIDGISSWWAVIHGYSHPEINAALKQQVDQVAHLMLGGLSHKPATALADKLCEITPIGLNHVFFSDSGSVGVEVALKMAIQFWKNIGKVGKTKIVSLKNGYHGDTFKAMEASDDSDFTSAFETVLHRGFLVQPPDGGYYAHEKLVEIAVNEVLALFTKHANEIACFILEPIIQCAGGMIIYSPEYLRAIKKLCEKYEVLLIFDEVATGFGRTGKLFAAEHAGVSPDIMVVGKALTAGYLGHAATLANTMVYNGFLGRNYETALMHGPTFMANPLACTVALKSIELIQKHGYISKIAEIEKIIVEEFKKITSPFIKDTRVIGAIGAIEMVNAEVLIGFNNYAAEQGVWLRPIGKILYLMPPYVIEKNELLQVIGVMNQWIKHLK